MGKVYLLISNRGLDGGSYIYGVYTTKLAARSAQAAEWARYCQQCEKLNLDPESVCISPDSDSRIMLILETELDKYNDLGIVPEINGRFGLPWTEVVEDLPRVEEFSQILNE